MTTTEIEKMFQDIECLTVSQVSLREDLSYLHDLEGKKTVAFCICKNSGWYYELLSNGMFYTVVERDEYYFTSNTDCEKKLRELAVDF